MPLIYPPVLRPMAAADLDAVIALADRSPGAPQWTRWIYQSALEHQQTEAYVALLDGGLIGFIMVHLVLDICELESIVVDPVFRRRGIGDALLQTIIAWSCQRAARRIELEVREGNAPAIALYERTGFLRDGIRENYYSDPEEDAVLMSLALEYLPKTVEKIP
jgi:[ribosomal protein S18]-alanine N-acetyltransferase